MLQIKSLVCGLLSLFLLSCEANFMPNAAERRGAGNVELKVACWNVQTFFDSTTDGCEYDEFKKSSRWGKEPYIERIERLCSVIKALDADVFVMEELENEGVLHDISNFLAGEWNSRKVYGHACFAKEDGGAIGCGVLSRWPLSDFTVHGLDVRTQKVSMPRMRPLMKVSVMKNCIPLVLMVNHWKSMSGGKEVSEKWRLMQESVLCECVAECEVQGLPVLACGDFNRDIGDFCLTDGFGGVLLRGKNGSGAEVSSPWYGEDGSIASPGSYFFDGEWSRIDHFFAGSHAVIEEFEPCTAGPWCREDTLVPVKYTVWNGNGYSDHLPIMCRVRY